MKNIIQDLKNFSSRLSKSNGDRFSIFPKKETFRVCLVLCVHREVKVKVWTLVESLQRCPDPKITRHTKSGDALIARSRASAAWAFIRDTKDEFMMFLDDDVNTTDTVGLTRMMWDAYENNLDIVGAAYVSKTDKNPKMMFRPLKEGSFFFGEGGKIEEVRYINTGCMMIHRKVLEKAIESNVMPFCKADNMEYFPLFNPWPYNLKTEEWWNPRVSDASLSGWNDLSEDWAACQRFRDLGFKVWLDTRIKLNHVGEYVYNFDDIERFKEPKKEMKNIEIKILPDPISAPALTEARPT